MLAMWLSWSLRVSGGYRACTLFGNIMFVVYIAAALAAVTRADLPGNLQLQEYAQAHPNPGILTTSYGYPVSASEYINGSRRDSNLLSAYSLEQLSSFSLERIPPRINHANGAGAKGTFEVLHDVSAITNAKIFSVGKKMPVIVRFSTGGGEKGSSELFNRGKGFAIKFYTEEGNMDLLGLSTNSFTVKDPVKAVNFVHPLRVNPKTGVPSTMMSLDFIANSPDALYSFVLIQISKLGQPKSYRHISGHALHTYQVENDGGEVSFVKFNWFPDSGREFLTNDEYTTIGATNPDYFTQDLYNSIANGTYPSWTLCMQVIPEKHMKKAKFDIFDITLNWPEKDWPNKPIGKFVLNKNLDNHFAENELAAYNPSNLVWGIRGCDKIFFARSFIYRDTQIHRMGTGFNKIPVNCPLTPAKTYNRDGNPPVGDNGGDAVNYYPDSFNGLVPIDRTYKAPLVRPNTSGAWANYWQFADYYKEQSEEDQKVIVNGLGNVFATAPAIVHDKLIEILKKVDDGLADAVKAVMDKAIAGSG